MATVDLGKIKIKWLGAYSGGTAYTPDDAVSYNGSSYICKLASTNNVPTNTTYWDVLSQKGTDGTDGTDLTSTLTTQGDILYRDASGLQRLAAGTNGQALLTGGAGANPSWGDAGGGILLAFNGEEDYASTSGTSSSSFIDAGSDIQITPTSTSDKVWVHVELTGAMGGGSGTYKVVRSVGGTDTDILTWTLGASQTREFSKWYKDSPSTTSQITYKLQIRSDQGNQGHFIYIQSNGFVSWQTLVTAN
ncbi:hypothetical protein [Hyphomonas sp.]|uniref:hypothetical protein n=1 Tax=Hyphomonas sp. TaxID=87 RepID=UPI0025C2E78E|nr:hypothetical protein [Hyphomonas sp.]|tara:strand:- start:1338 stop:2081 length:744 start_codon:yes stop_codon:yes gene_type:complete